ELLENLLRSANFDVIIHAAAVSDYSIESVSAGEEILRPIELKKINSDTENITISLKRNFKIIERLLSYSQTGPRRGRPIIVAFKLTNTADAHERLQKIKKLFSSGAVDLVVHNDFRDLHKEAGPSLFTIYMTSGGEPHEKARSIGRTALAADLERITKTIMEVHDDSGS
ncbi:MAG: phosphopantothenoylcysteine decarboxylase, partial [Bdellovibrionota bacterium]